MSKKEINLVTLAAYLFAAFVLYIAYCFKNVTFNPETWSVEDRAVYLFSMVGSGVLFGIRCIIRIFEK